MYNVEDSVDETVHRSFMNVINKIIKNTNNVEDIYHYTSQSAYLNIIKEKELWLSDIGTLNDPKEIIFGLEVIENYLKQRIDNKNSKVLEWLENYNPYNPKKFMNIHDEPIFIMSFSEEEDMMSQWVSYGDEGYGVSMSFLKNGIIPKLSKMINPIDGPILMPISYYANNYEFSGTGIFNYLEHISTLFLKIEEITKNNRDCSDILHITRRLFFEYLYIFASYIKHDFYKEEKEWRLFVKTGPGDKNISIVPKNKQIKKIYKVPLCGEDEEKYFLSEIHRDVIIGPRYFNNESIKSTIDLLYFQEVETRLSGIQRIARFSNGILN